MHSHFYWILESLSFVNLTQASATSTIRILNASNAPLDSYYINTATAQVYRDVDDTAWRPSLTVLPAGYKIRGEVATFTADDDLEFQFRGCKVS